MPTIISQAEADARGISYDIEVVFSPSDDAENVIFERNLYGWKPQQVAAELALYIDRLSLLPLEIRE